MFGDKLLGHKGPTDKANDSDIHRGGRLRRSLLPPEGTMRRNPDFPFPRTALPTPLFLKDWVAGLRER